MTSRLYLAPNVVMEPLYQQWYAWPHLVSPATAAMNVVHRHLRIMDSFLLGPAVHERFSRDPKMVGSPFMSHPAARVEEVRALRDETLQRAASMIELAGALAALQTLLDGEARGQSLDALHARVPEPLRGMVELTYGHDHHARYRLVEPLLYRSRYYDASSQSIALHAVDRDTRPFILTTPRLSSDPVLRLDVAFASPAIDALAEVRTRPVSYARIRERVPIAASQEADFRALFTTTPPQRRDEPRRGEVRIRYFGHACVLVEDGGVSILTDPCVSPRSDDALPRFTLADLPDRIDAVLITHNHQDHVLLETLLQLRHRIGRVIVPRDSGGDLADPSLRLMFRALGFANVETIDELDSLAIGGCTITGLPFNGEHADLDIRSKITYHVALSNGLTILFAADSNVVEPRVHELVHAVTGDVDMLFLGMECDGAPLSWLYGPLLARKLPRELDHSRRLAGSDCARAMDMVRRFRPSEVYVYAMGQEPWLRHIMGLEYTAESRPIAESDRLVAECRAMGITAERLYGSASMTRSRHRGAWRGRDDAA